jgi:uncharacterized membrane protein YfhO
MVKEYKQRGFRRNGFSLKFGVNYYQIISWVYCLMDMLLVYVFVLNLPEDKFVLQTGLLVWHTLEVMVIVSSCILATGTDTTDQTLIK